MRLRRWTARGPGAWAIPVLLALWAAPGVAGGGAGPDDPTPRTRVHDDAREVLRAFVEALDALLVEDPARAKLALDRVAAASPPVMPETRRQFGEAVVGGDAAFHKLLNLAREVANRGDGALALRYHQGLQRACLDCHGFAREAGVLRTSSPGDSESPTPPTASTPSR